MAWCSVEYPAFSYAPEQKGFIFGEIFSQKPRHLRGEADFPTDTF
jgi:hypothetical protein